MQASTTVETLARKALVDDNDEYCCRGLLAKTEYRNRRNAILGALVEVLREQELQQFLEDVILDEEMLADVFFESTRQSYSKALQRALREVEEREGTEKLTDPSTTAHQQGRSRTIHMFESRKKVVAARQA
jgi:hypothetical protein